MLAAFCFGTPGTPTRRHALGRLPTPPPLPENLLLGLHRKLPSEPPASTQEVSESEVPVHVHPFAARVPSDSKGSECQCGIHRAEAASALRSRKTERAAKEKPTPISQFFKHRPSGWHPNSPPRPGEAPHPAPSARKSATQTAQKTALCAPWEHPGGFGIRKSASNSGHSPLRGSG